MFTGLITKGQDLNATKKKKKKPMDDFAAEIEEENRGNEKDDETSAEEDSSSGVESDEDAKLKMNAKRDIVVKEEDYEENEKLNFSADVYNFTICANMTKCCSPV